MFFRKVNVSDECVKWLNKSESIDVTPEEAKSKFDNRCAEIRDEVIHAIMTEPEEEASADGKVEVIVEVSLAKAEKLKIMVVITSVYAVVYTKNKKKYYVVLDENSQLKKITKIGDELQVIIDGGNYIELLEILEKRRYRISM